MTNSSKKKLIFTAIAVVLLVSATVCFLSLYMSETIENDGIKAEYTLRGSILKISFKSDDDAVGKWYLLLSDDKDKRELESNSASEVKVKLSLDGSDNGLEISMYFEENGIITKNLNLITYTDEKNKIKIRNFKADNLKNYLDTAYKITENILFPGGVILTNAVNDPKGEMTEISLIYDGKKYVYILSDKVKFSEMLEGLSEKMSELGISKRMLNVGDAYIKGYSYEKDNKMYNICYWINGETRCYLSSEEASFEDLINFIRKSKKV